MDHVVLDILDAGDQIADDPGVVRDRDAQRVFHCSHGAGGVDRRADAADTLGEEPGVARVAALEDELDAAEHGARAPRLGDFAAVHLRLDPQVSLDPRDRVDGDLGHHRSSSLAFWLLVDRAQLGADRGGHAVGGEHRRGAADDPGADPVRRGLHAESRHGRQAPIERRHRVPEVALGAADAAVSGAHRPARALVPAHHGAVVEGGWALAAHLVEAPAVAVPLVAPLLHELPRVEVGAALAVVVDARAVGEERAALAGPSPAARRRSGSARSSR